MRRLAGRRLADSKSYIGRLLLGQEPRHAIRVHRTKWYPPYYVSVERP